ncbi:CHAT domain-containing protein [Solirubrobacter ginsenosidimutans]|uniref:CHAT domain-containing protein n=1 Tax=Solirubrobacter ginsenosidimutans TaxID=490573 RepID=A0A9X3S0K7_9ACTN|nr:CHAT domain-containing protein [Solirubrobacter ginsenosidimutans]MDA0159286.1 CHAT domain-containing protein [Solirubrobacter ginsenosidimutans]
MNLPQGYFNALPLVFGEPIASRPAFGPPEVVALGGDPLTQAWRLWAVGQTNIHLQRVGRGIEWFAAASRLGATSPLLTAEISTGFGWEALRVDEPGGALGEVLAADAAWEALIEQCFDERWPQVWALVAEQITALDRGQPLPGDSSPGQLIQIWRSTRAAAARTQVWNGLADVYNRIGNEKAAVALVHDGITWLRERFPIGVPTQAHDLVWQLEMTLGAIQQHTAEGLEAFRRAKAMYVDAPWASAADHRVAVSGLGEANALAALRRQAEALPVYEQSAEILERWQQPAEALQCRQGALLARAELGRAPNLEAELRALLGAVESELGRPGSSTGFAAKSVFTVSYTRLLLTLAEQPITPARAEAYADVVEALRRPEVLSDVGRDAPGGWISDVRGRVALAAARLQARPDWCLLVVESGGYPLTFMTIRGGAGSVAERIALSTASSQLMDALTPFMLQVSGALDVAIESATLTQGLEEPDLVKAAEAIWAQLPDAVRDTLSAARTILYAPDPFGSLDELPLEAVRAPDGWLGETRVIARQRSIDDAIRALAPTAPGAARNALILRAPESPDFAALGHADEESQLVERAGPLLGLDTADPLTPGSEAELIDALSRPAALIHFIGHGVANALSEGIPVGDGALGVHRLPPLSGRPVCFMNACELGRSRHIQGGGGRGLVPALRDAGASAVLAWTQAAPDRLGPLFAREFYRATRDGLDVGGALVAARTRLHERGVSPAVTACLGLFGDPRAHVSPAEAAEDGSWADALTRYIATRDPADEQVALTRLEATPHGAAVIAWLEGGPDNGLFERLAREDPLGAAALGMLQVRQLVEQTRLRDDDDWPYLSMGLELSERSSATLAHASFCLDFGKLGLGKFPREACLTQLRTAVRELEPWREASPALAALHREAVRNLRSLDGGVLAVLAG